MIPGLRRGFGSVEKGNESELNTSKDIRGFESNMTLIEFRKTISSVGLSSRIKLSEARCELRPAAGQRYENQVKSRGRSLNPHR